ncbi:hypothetical protein CMQ_90 [Grosmannia clavigera kw1407]|uniref:Uncharacterized protein n=1 Tax=Grosmannia clavigera (strain kw1407 / UAMH 11150) TaxID=655863 RepID=F0XQN2_GROCL|nr:uncharacterized protein CMQ_90 [Grosmannia clavigera kw1407]EFW99772.1 hypothetical protein CMQ_90 [Grosmannia clavigera kw1407]
MLENSSYDDRLTDSDSTDGMDGMDGMDDMDDTDDTDGMDDHDSPGIANIEDTEMDMGPIQMASEESHLLEPTESGTAEGGLLVSNYNLPEGESRGDFVSWSDFDAGLSHPSLQFAPRNWETFDIDAYFDFDAYYNDAGPNLGGFISPGQQWWPYRAT